MYIPLFLPGKCISFLALSFIKIFGITIKIIFILEKGKCRKTLELPLHLLSARTDTHRIYVSNLCSPRMGARIKNECTYASLCMVNLFRMKFHLQRDFATRMASSLISRLNNWPSSGQSWKRGSGDNVAESRRNIEMGARTNMRKISRVPLWWHLHTLVRTGGPCNASENINRPVHGRRRKITP